MIERVVIGKASTNSPLRVSAAGVDANLAAFEDLLFDGNQPPLRLHHVGYVMIADKNPSNFAPAIISSAVFPALPGYPQFSVMSRWTNPSGVVFDPRCAYRAGQAGAGGVVNPGVFWGVDWNSKFADAGAQSYTHINFCIFKNYLP